MESLGRRQLSAPKAATVTAIPVCAAATSDTVYATFNAVVITAATVVGATSVAVSEKRGLATNDYIRLGYGTANEELVKVTAIGGGVGTGNSTLTISAATKAHALNEKAIANLKPIVPGTLSVKSTSTVIATDDGAGALVAQNASGVTGTVDYSSGLVSVTYGGASSRTITYGADTFSDSADINDQKGDGFMRNMQVLSFSPHDAPSTIVAKNLGVSTVGFIVEKSVNNGLSFVQLAAKSGTLSSLAKKALTMPALQGSDLVRVRASAASSGAGSILEVDTLQDITDNGQ